MTNSEENTKKLLCYINEFCPKELNSVEILKFFQLLLAAHWEHADNHGQYAQYLSCIDNRGLVETTLDENPKGVKTVPKISIKLGEVKFEKAHLGDEKAESEDGNILTFGWGCSTQLIFNHRFETPGQTLIAAESTFEFLSAIANEVRQLLNLTTFLPVGISQPKKEKNQASDNFNLDIVFNISYNYYVSANLETHRIKVIASTISIQ